MKRLWILLAALLLAGVLPGIPARAEEAGLRIALSESEVLPGRPVTVSFTVPEDGVCTIVVADSKGDTVAGVVENRPARAGENTLYWNGTWRGLAVPAGDWTLRLEMNGRTAEVPVTVGKMIPVLISPAADRDTVTAGRKVNLSYWATEAGVLRVTVGENLLYEAETAEGSGAVSVEAALPPGGYMLEATLTRADGTGSLPFAFPLTVEEPPAGFTALGSGGAGDDYRLNAWTLPLDITDEEAVWQALTAPVTVLDDGKEKAQVRQTVVRREPDPESPGIGVVTMASQGVHVLEKGETWSLIECFSASFHDSEILNWNAPIRGWVETRLLKTIRPNQQMGLVVDKLTQRMYVFRDGKLFSTLLVSTGLPNERQPYNETRSGEFLLVSRVGGFYSDNMYCPRAIRFNDGDLIHEVPYIDRTTIDYSSTEPKLGTRASHGCVRVQRRRNPEGLNQEWLFNTYQANTKILIWEDWQGRQIPVPADDAVFWRNAGKNDYYHCSDHCPQLGTRRPAEITYGELSSEQSRLRACPACGPVPKKDALLEINARYAPGGDHSPVMTEARKDCPKNLKER